MTDKLTEEQIQKVPVDPIAYLQDLTPIPIGTIFYCSSGCYSNYMVNGLYKALVELRAYELVNEYRAYRTKNHSDDPGWDDHSFDDEEFTTFLIKTARVEEIEHMEWHLDDYGEVGDMGVWERGGENG